MSQAHVGSISQLSQDEDGNEIKFVDVSAGVCHSLIVSEDGDCYAFGSSRGEVLGLGDVGYAVKFPTKIKTFILLFSILFSKLF